VGGESLATLFSFFIFFGNGSDGHRGQTPFFYFLGLFEFFKILLRIGAPQRGALRESKGLAPWCRNVFLFATANKKTCDFGLPKSVFFRLFFATRQRIGIRYP
jgi:hypothetical protein